MIPSGWITPDWPVPPGVRAVCTVREGGVSVGPFESLNLGDHVGDNAAHVASNRNRLSEALAAKPVFLNQVHGRHVAALDAETPDATQADGCVTPQRGIACTIMVADCLPVLFATRNGKAVGAAHAGWRGLAGENGRGVIEATSDALEAASGATPADIVAWLGPCIGPEQFEVGPEVKAAFEAIDFQAVVCFRPLRKGKWLADLPALARRRLQQSGITEIHGNDGGTDWCTVSNPSRFFSYRRDRVSGRFAACVWLA
jgi:YfiH family protein